MINFKASCFPISDDETSSCRVRNNPTGLGRNVGIGNLHHQGSLNKVYKRITRDCNDAEFLKNEDPKILLPNFSCHNLRHTFATRLCESGANMKAIQRILGHSNLATTMDIYTESTGEMSNTAIGLYENELVQNSELIHACCTRQYNIPLSFGMKV